MTLYKMVKSEKWAEPMVWSSVGKTPKAGHSFAIRSIVPAISHIERSELCKNASRCLMYSTYRPQKRYIHSSSLGPIFDALLIRYCTLGGPTIVHRWRNIGKCGRLS